MHRHTHTHARTQLTACTGSSSQRGDGRFLMTQCLWERCFHNYLLSDMDLSLALIVCPDGRKACERDRAKTGEKMFGPRRAGQVAIQEPMGGPNWSQWWDWYRVNGSTGSKICGSRTIRGTGMWSSCESSSSFGTNCTCRPKTYCAYLEPVETWLTCIILHCVLVLHMHYKGARSYLEECIYFFVCVYDCKMRRLRIKTCWLWASY